jgi:hypothetical protein
MVPGDVGYSFIPPVTAFFFSIEFLAYKNVLHSVDLCVKFYVA